MDEDSRELAEVAGKALAEGSTRAFLDTIFGPAVEVGELLRDQVRFIRFVVQVKMFKRASALLEKEGIPAQQVSLKLLVPLLELSSLEDENDDTMVDLWAALLANAAAGPDRGAAVLPSFPRILTELSAEEAWIVDRLYSPPDKEQVPSLFWTYAEDKWAEDDPLFYTRCFNLARLGLLEVSWENVQVDGTDPPVYKHTVSRVAGTALGLSFIRACTPPA